MLQAFVITLREGLEAFLIVAISVAFLRKSGRSDLIPAVRWGIAISLLLSIAAALLFQRAANHALWEGILALLAAVSVTFLTVQTWRAARRLKSEIQTHLSRSMLETGDTAFVGVLFFTVLMMTREGMETAVLLGTLLFQVRSMNLIIGATIGIASAAAVAMSWSRYGHRVNLGLFFQGTAVFLFVFFAQLLVY